MTDTELNEKFDKLNAKLDSVVNEIAAMLENQTANIQIIIEADVSKKVDALMDAYTGSHEKQTELEVRTTRLEQRVEDLEIKVS